jgi:hypothetical protein
MTSPEWDLARGDILSREDRMRRFGGSKQNGIAPSGQSPNVFIYSDSTAKDEFGYADEWTDGGEVLLYNGDGQVGDQSFDTRGNRAVRDHKKEGRALRLFEAAGTKPGTQEVIQRYAGRMEIDDDEPYAIRVGVPDINKDLRSVIVFKLRRVADEVTAEGDRLPPLAPATESGADSNGGPVVKTVPVEKSNKEHFDAECKALSKKERTRIEAKLQKKYRKHLESDLNRTVCRHQILIDGQTLYTDLYDETADDLIEVKSSTDRKTMRLALGQILDYAQILNPASRTLLVPNKPLQSVVVLFQSHNIRVVWWDGEAFEDSQQE